MEKESQTTIDNIEASIDAFDEKEPNGDNSSAVENSESALADGEEAQTVRALGEQIEALKSDNERLLKAVDRMVRLYGARFSENNSQGIEAFPKDPMNVEPTFGDEIADVPTLDQIKLS